MEFDFSSYLTSRYPGTTWAVEQLSGGLVNDTSRARRTSGDSPHESLVLKYAPPYVRTVGPDLPFSQERQAVEATMLGYFLEDGPLAHLPRGGKSSVAVPDLVHYDPEKFVLIIKDLGPLGTLWDLFEACGKSPAAAATAPAVDVSVFASLGSRIGQFFAGVHSRRWAEDFDITKVPVLSQRLADELVWAHAVEPVQGRLEEFNIPDAPELFNAVTKDHRDPEGKNFPCVSIGDFHPGCILVDKAVAQMPVSGGETTTPTVAVIDWEFATNHGRGVNGDMAQFLSELHAYIIALEGEPTPANNFTRKAVQSFVDGVGNGYRAGMDWNRITTSSQNSDAEEPLLEHLIRSALILHGREMINHAYGRFESAPAAVRERMVREGASNIARALASDIASLEREEASHSRMIKSLFFD